MALAADKLKDLMAIVTRLLPMTTTVPPSLAADEVGVELDTGKLKIGDGSTPWASLPYLTPGGGSGATGATGPTGPAGGGSGGVQSAFHLLTASEIRGLDVTPIQIVPAPGPGKILTPLLGAAQLTYSGTPFAGGNAGDISLSYTDGNGPIAVGTIVPNFLITGTSDLFESAIAALNLGNYTPTDIINQPLVLFNANGAAYTGGNTSTILVTVFYTVVDSA